MRETFIALIVVGILIGAFFYFYQNQSLGPRIGIPSSQSHTQNDGDGIDNPFQNHHASQLNAKGVQNDNETDQGEAGSVAASGEAGSTAASGEEEGSSSEVAKSKELYSIYQRKSVSKVRKKKAKAVGNQAKHKAKGKVVHGVPLQAWVHSQKDKIFLPAVTGDTGDGLRVFLQCMELKSKGPEYLGQKECEGLLVRHSTDRGGSKIK